MFFLQPYPIPPLLNWCDHWKVTITQIVHAIKPAPPHQKKLLIKKPPHQKHYAFKTNQVPSHQKNHATSSPQQTKTQIQILIIVSTKGCP